MDERARGIVTAEYIATRIANQSIGMISIPENGQAFRFSLSDGAHLRFQLTPNGADITHFVPSKK